MDCTKKHVKQVALFHINTYFFFFFFCESVLSPLHADEEDPMLTAVLLSTLNVHQLSRLMTVTAEKAERMVGKGCSFGSKLNRREGLAGQRSWMLKPFAMALTLFYIFHL